MDLQPRKWGRGVLLCPRWLGIRSRRLRQDLGEEGRVQAAGAATDAVGELRAERQDEKGGINPDRYTVIRK